MAPSVTRWLLEKHYVWRLRNEALEVVRLREPLPEDPHDAYAQLALLRSLYLERELRRVSLFRQREAVAVLARGVIEAAFVGLYVLLEEDEAVDRFTLGEAHRLSKLVKRWAPSWMEAQASLEHIFQIEGQPGMPNLRQIMERLDEAVDCGTHLDEPVGSYFYHHWYVPLSTLSAHTSHVALGRHYDFGSRTVRRRPWGIVPRRGAIRASDAAVALLAAELRERHGLDSAWLRRYSHSQLELANVPVAVLLAQAAWGLVRSVGFRGVIRLIVAIIRLRAELMGVEDDDERRARIEEFMPAIGIDDPQLVDWFADRMATHLIEESRL